MKQLIAVFCALLAFASAINVVKSDEPYDWNYFLKEVETTCKDVEIHKTQLEKDISNDPTVRSNQIKYVEQMLTRIILIQDMIDYEFRYRDTLDNSQKNLLESFKNKALRLRQELNNLKNKLKN